MEGQSAITLVGLARFILLIMDSPIGQFLGGQRVIYLPTVRLLNPHMSINTPLKNTEIECFYFWKCMIIVMAVVLAILLSRSIGCTKKLKAVIIIPRMIYAKALS